MLKKATVIFDEADYALLHKAFRFSAEEPPKVLAAAAKLGECKSVICFTGTLSKAALS